MTTPVYCRWEAVRKRVAVGLHTAVESLPAQFDDVFPEATKDAAAEIKQIFVLKGYTPAQLASSDDIRIWNEMLGAFFSFVRLVGLANFDLKAVEYLDCRKKMAEAAALVVGDAAIAPTPGGSAVGGIAAGQDSGVDEVMCEAKRRGIFD